MQPQQVQGQQAAQTLTTESPQVDTSTALKQSLLVYISGLSRFSAANRHPAVLEWGADNRIRLYVGGYQGQQQAVLFDCPPQEIKSFSTGMGVGNIKLQNGQTFSLDFSPGAGQALMLGGATHMFGIGGFIGSTLLDKHAAKLESGTDLEWWTQTLSRYGVGGLQMTAAKMYSIDKAGWWGLAITVGVIFLVLLFLGFAYVFGQ